VSTVVVPAGPCGPAASWPALKSAAPSEATSEVLKEPFRKSLPVRLPSSTSRPVTDWLRRSDPVTVPFRTEAPVSVAAA
jgi:hypothetical protein